MTQNELTQHNTIAWEEGEPAQTLLAPEQSISAIVSTLDGQVFFLTEDGRVYISTLKQESAGLTGKIRELALPCQCVVSLACTSSHILFVTDRGRVLRSDLVTPEKVEEFKVKPQFVCSHGVCENGARLITRELSCHSQRILLVSDSGKIWTIDDSKSKHPSTIPALEDKTLLSVVSGNDFSAVLVQEYPEPDEKDQSSKISTGDHKNKPIYLPSCPDCREQELKSREQICEEKTGQFGPGQGTNDSNTLAQACWSKADHLVRQSALLLNSEAAKQFLNRQLSWVTGSSDLDDNQEDIIAEKKDNSKVTSRVAEGVRNIGDAVNRLSRHWSNSSQEEKDKDSCETVSLPNGSTGSTTTEASLTTVAAPRLFRQVLGRRPKWKRQESTSLSMDCVADPPASAAARSAELNQIIFAGRCLLNTSVWTWGRAKKGQLGQSDCVSRDQPTCIRSLNAVGICKLVAGSFHCLALTLDGRVFAWGSNNRGQIGPGEGDLSFMCSAHEMSLPVRTSVRDIAAGGEHSLLLTTSGQVFFVGFSLATQKPTMMRLNLPVHSPAHSVQFVAQRIWASGSLSCCYSSVQSCGCGCTELWTEFLISEQLFLRSCFNVFHAVFDALLPASGTNTSSARMVLFGYYRQLVASVAYNVHTLLKVPYSGKDVAVIRWMEEYIQLYECYSQALCNALVVNALHLSKTEATQLDKIFRTDKRWSGMNELSPEWKISTPATCSPLQRLMMEPMERLREYAFHLDRLVSAHSEGKEHCNVAHLARASRHYTEAATAMEIEYQKADLTRAFWDSCSSKLIDALRTPERRLIRESRSHPINVVSSGLFSSHWFIILTDVLVHVGYSGHVVYPLNTIWAEPVQDSETQNCLVLTMPEETLSLCCPTGKDKIEWFTTLQSAIVTSLASASVDQMSCTSSTNSINSIGGNTSPVKSSHCSPPLARFASYVFTKSAILKDVSYKGYWFCGKMHGVGELRWPDGRVYNGNLRQNMQYGYGVLETPGPSGTCYEGNWKDGKMSGYGTLKYANGDVYEGFFQDNQPHGHGTLKRGHFLTSAADVYVGQWDSGQKHGYGVMDDIVAGEKYMGMWQGDAKHGSAVLVTLDGLYIEGCFNNNKMTGQCVMLLEDGTSYEGEVAGVGILGGKGLMRLPNGDVIRGTFHGSWGDGIKINATFTKAPSSNVAVDEPTSNQAVTNQYCVPAKRKWEAIFRQCSHSLGLPLVNSVWVKEDTSKAWEQIAIIVCQHVGKAPADVTPLRRNGSTATTSYSSSGSRADLSVEKRSEISEVLQRIPEYGRDQLNQQQLAKIETYLLMALDWNVHPLGRMIGQLVDVYRSTYVGVGAHPRLLPHAIEEVHSFVRRIYSYVRLLFPALPPEDRPTYINSNNSASDDSNNATMVSASSLLLPLLLPRVYPPLFTLYVLYNEKQDELYWERLLKWNKQSDLALMNFLGVDTKFYEEDICDGHFSGAVDCLQQISTTFSPKEKLLVIQSTFHEIKSLNQSHLGQSYVLSMDDLFPLFQFVVVRSGIRNLGSEIQLIEDFIEHQFLSGELDMMFTIVKAAYHYIQHEKMTFT